MLKIVIKTIHRFFWWNLKNTYSDKSACFQLAVSAWSEVEVYCMAYKVVHTTKSSQKRINDRKAFWIIICQRCWVQTHFVTLKCSLVNSYETHSILVYKEYAYLLMGIWMSCSHFAFARMILPLQNETMSMPLPLPFPFPLETLSLPSQRSIKKRIICQWIEYTFKLTSFRMYKAFTLRMFTRTVYLPKW